MSDVSDVSHVFDVIDALDVIEGFMGALTKTDVRPQYDQCYEGVPAIIDELEQVERIDFSNLLGFFSQLMVALPKEFSSCSTIVTGIPSFFIHLFTTINLALLLTNLQTQSMQVLMQLMAKGTDVGAAFASEDFYRLG